MDLQVPLAVPGVTVMPRMGKFKTSIDGAMQKIDKIFLWSLISSTVGVISNFIIVRLRLINCSTVYDNLT